MDEDYQRAIRISLEEEQRRQETVRVPQPETGNPLPAPSQTTGKIEKE